MMRLRDSLRALVRPDTVTEFATVSEVSGSKARVKRQGQNAATHLIPNKTGVTLNVGDRVELTLPRGQLNGVGYISRKL